MFLHQKKHVDFDMKNETFDLKELSWETFSNLLTIAYYKTKKYCSNKRK